MRPLQSLAAIVLLAVAPLTPADPGPPEGMLTNLLRHPEETVITDARPRFSWIVSDAARGAVQSAYQVRVSAGEAGPVIWDSEKVASDRSVAVAYTGPALEQNGSYWWEVRTWDGQDRASSWSARQRFNTGAFASTRPAEDRWVEFDGPPEKGRHLVIENLHPVSYHPLPPVSVEKVDPGRFFVDFGRAAFATIRLTLTSPAEGRAVTILLGEKKTPDNHVDLKPGGSIYAGSHTFKLRQGTHTYDLVLPRHVSKMPHSLVLPAAMPEVEPFRYAEIVDAPSDVTAKDVRQVALFYAFDDDAADFNCSDPDLNAVWALCKYTLKATPFIGTYTDGVRERMPYEADAYIQALGHYCVDREYAVARHSAEFLYYNATWPTEWILLSVLTAHADYMNTGDAESLRRNYDTLKAKLLLPLAREDGLISTRTGKVTPALLAAVHYNGKALKDITDWPVATETDGFQFADYNAVVNALHYRALVQMTDIARATDNLDDSELFRARAERVKDAFNKRFFNPATKLYVDGEGLAHSSLHANAFALALGLVPADRVVPIVDFLKTRQMACGPYGAQFLLDALYGAGNGEAAYALLTNTSDRGWLNMIRAGSTMTTEAWDIKYKKNLTWNHAWGAAPANLIARKLMGVEPIDSGFKRLRIAPQPAGLKSATLKLPTIRGTVLLAYRRTDDTVTLDVTIPANTTAELHLPPCCDPATLRESDQAADANPALRKIAPAVYEFGGGTYHFVARTPKT